MLAERQLTQFVNELHHPAAKKVKAFMTGRKPRLRLP